MNSILISQIDSFISSANEVGQVLKPRVLVVITIARIV